MFGLVFLDWLFGTLWLWCGLFVVSLLVVLFVIVFTLVYVVCVA